MSFKSETVILDNSKEELMLTTLDNPYNPFTQFENWYAFDVMSGYNTCAYLARIAPVSDDLSSFHEQEAIERGMREIVELNVTGNYILVSRTSFKDRSKDVVNP